MDRSRSNLPRTLSDLMGDGTLLHSTDSIKSWIARNGTVIVDVIGEFGISMRPPMDQDPAGASGAGDAPAPGLLFPRHSSMKSCKFLRGEETGWLGVLHRLFS